MEVRAAGVHEIPLRGLDGEGHLDQVSVLPEHGRRGIGRAVSRLRARAYASPRPPAATTVTDIAERAGVGRVTVYRHLPDETALAGACSGRDLAPRGRGARRPLPGARGAAARR